MSESATLPQRPNRIATDVIIRRYQCQTVFDGLTEQHPAKGIVIDNQHYSRFYSGQQLGKIGFGFMNIDYFHNNQLQNMTNITGY